MYLYELSTYPKQLTCNVISWQLMIFIIDWWVWFDTNFCFRKLEPMHTEVNLADSRHAYYSYVHMQKKLKEYFGIRIIETEINGKPSVVTFRSKAKTILHDFYNHRNADPDIEKMRIIEAAAKLIRDDIKAVETRHDVYPACDEHDLNNVSTFYLKACKYFLTG